MVRAMHVKWNDIRKQFLANMILTVTFMLIAKYIVDTPYTDNLYLIDTACVPTSYKCVKILRTPLLRTLMLVPKHPLNRGSTV